MTVGERMVLKGIREDDDFDLSGLYDEGEIVGKVGLLDKQGAELIPPLYYLLQLEEEFITAMKAGDLIWDDDHDTDWEADIDYVLGGGKWGVIDWEHKIIVPFNYEYILDCKPYVNAAGLFLVNKDGRLNYRLGHQEDYGTWDALGGKWGLINSKNEVLVPPAYRYYMLTMIRYCFIITMRRSMKKTVKPM
jgi:hypothetical protein